VCVCVCALKRLLVIEDSATITLKRSRLNGICNTKTVLLYFSSEVMTVKDEDILKERVKEAREASRFSLDIVFLLTAVMLVLSAF